jgi:hypothetical protein
VEHRGSLGEADAVFPKVSVSLAGIPLEHAGSLTDAGNQPNGGFSGERSEVRCKPG